MKTRKYLKKNQQINLYKESDGKSIQRSFSIIKKISEDSSVVCYEATIDQNIYGILREFYPKDAPLQRLKTGALTISSQSEDETISFLEKRDAYINSYKMILNVKQDPIHKDFKTFIPQFEFYYGFDDIQMNKGTLYIWEFDPQIKPIKNKQENININASLTMLYHLYKYPLYLCIPEDEININIAIIGFEKYSQMFLDSCLQAGQMNGKIINVTIYLDDTIKKDQYLNERKELANFFNVDGSQANQNDHYGNITFQQIQFDYHHVKKNKKLIEDVLLSHFEIEPFHYIFISLGDDQFNSSTALSCKSVSDVVEKPCCINYVSESGKFMRGKKLIYPVYVNQNIEALEIYDELERMAFNMHLVWEKNLNIDIKEIRKEFKKIYNHDSCISAVLSLKYKLYSIGIDLDQINNIEAAIQFNKIFGNKKNRKLKNELVYIEHRRWVSEKICQGWSRIIDLKECLYGTTKDEKKKRHICIVKSKPNQRLISEFRTNHTKDKWDSASDEEINRLDELDQMSVKLHRMYKEYADQIDTQGLLYGANLSAIKNRIGNNKKVIFAFQEWFSCLKDIRNGDANKVSFYKGLKNNLIESLQELSYEKRIVIHEQIKAFDMEIYPLIAAYEYKDYKQLDVAIIDHIPFILTYSADAYMVIPFMSGNNSEIFMNVASASVVNPKGLIYLCLIDNNSDINTIKNCIPYISEYMIKKKFQAKPEMVFIYDQKLDIDTINNFSKEIVTLGKGKIKQHIKRIPYENIHQIPSLLSAYLKQKRNGKKLFAIEKNASKLSYMLQAFKLYDDFANYEFDCENIKFRQMVKCNAFGYINKNVYISVSDMAAFRMSTSDSSNQPEFFDDYKSLWKKYRDNGMSVVWKLLCDTLSDHASKNDIIATFKKRNACDKTANSKQYTFILPYACIHTVTKIVNELIAYEICEAESRTQGYTSDACEVIIYDRCNHELEYQKLFSNIYALVSIDAIDVFFNPKTQELSIRFNNLMVKDLKLNGNKSTEMKKLLDYFVNMHYIINLQQAVDDSYSFTYATYKIKELLTTSGKILEIYTYHKIKESLSFDDVVSSYEINWEKTPIKNEFDCIVTKGFKTLFIECKARPIIEQDFYYKLSSLSRQFGINAKAILIVDTQEQNINDINVLQRQRGNMVDVITIWKQDEINNIGQTLIKVIKDEYENKIE